ncbi:MAG: MFS transporter [Clostridia bacterium]|nr:MFS transporter [Clostridia bacterium]MCR4576649.1 MFS transporter [Clostridiales bacterium]
MRKFFKSKLISGALFLMAYYAANAVFQSFMSLYLTDRGLNGAKIGTINAVIAFVSVPTMYLWGRAGDRAASRNRLLAAMAVISTAVILLLPLQGGFVYALGVLGLFGCVYTSLQPMGDSIVLTNLDSEGLPFGGVRLAGGLTFAVVAALFGYVSDYFGSVTVVYGTAAMCLMVALAALNMPTVSSKGQAASAQGAGKLLRNPEVIRLFALMVLLQITYGYYYAFFSPLLRDDLGGGENLVGWSFFISACSEAPFLIFSDRLIKKLGAGKLMCMAAAVMTVRWMILATTSSPYVALAAQVLHGFGFIVITVSAAKYIQKVAGDGEKATGQLLLGVFGFGLARGIGYLAGGALSDVITRQGVFYITAGICFFCLAAFAPYYFRHKPLNGED